MPAYSEKAQPYLDAIAESVFTLQDVRDWLIAGTPVEANYAESGVLNCQRRNNITPVAGVKMHHFGAAEDCP